MSDLFSNLRPKQQEIEPQVWVLANFVDTTPLLNAVNTITEQAPFRKMMTPMGHYTGIPFTNCGDYGWTSDMNGYRYATNDPQTGLPWPKMPLILSKLATRAAHMVGYDNFHPDACLINEYKIGARLNAHQDKNEVNYDWPIVSVSIGLPAIFQIFGDQRNGKAKEYSLYDGDVMVWGGCSRLIYHGVKAVKAAPQTPNLKKRINITFRRAT